MVERKIFRSGKIYNLLATSLSKKANAQKKLSYKHLYKSIITIKKKAIFDKKMKVDHYYLYGHYRL